MATWNAFRWVTSGSRCMSTERNWARFAGFASSKCHLRLCSHASRLVSHLAATCRLRWTHCSVAGTRLKPVLAPGHESCLLERLRWPVRLSTNGAHPTSDPGFPPYAQHLSGYPSFRQQRQILKKKIPKIPSRPGAFIIILSASALVPATASASRIMALPKRIVKETERLLAEP